MSPKKLVNFVNSVNKNWTQNRHARISINYKKITVIHITRLVIVSVFGFLGVLQSMTYMGVLASKLPSPSGESLATACRRFIHSCLLI